MEDKWSEEDKQDGRRRTKMLSHALSLHNDECHYDKSSLYDFYESNERTNERTYIFSASRLLLLVRVLIRTHSPLIVIYSIMYMSVATKYKMK